MQLIIKSDERINFVLELKSQGLSMTKRTNYLDGNYS